MNTVPFSQQLRDAYEEKFKSVRRLHAALVKIYGEDAICQNTIKRILNVKDYRPRGKRPFLQLKQVLPKLAIPVQVGEMPIESKRAN